MLGYVGIGARTNYILNLILLDLLRLCFKYVACSGTDSSSYRCSVLKHISLEIGAKRWGAAFVFPRTCASKKTTSYTRY